MDCHYKTNPSARIPPVHQTLPVQQHVTRTGKGGDKNLLLGGTTWNLLKCWQLPDLHVWPQRKRQTCASLEEQQLPLLLPENGYMCTRAQRHAGGEQEL